METAIAAPVAGCPAGAAANVPLVVRRRSVQGAAMRLLVLVLSALVLASCGGLNLPFGKPPKATVANVPRERTVNPEEAARLINAYRATRGRPPVSTEPRLTRIAAETAQKLAGRNKVKTEMHTPEGLMRRLEAAGYPDVRAAENLGAGYPTLALAIDGWKGSSDHNRNLLNADFTEMGIGLALTDKGPFHSFWVLVLATPGEPS
jgi:uncharacterized protein YkwD